MPEIEAVDRAGDYKTGDLYATKADIVAALGFEPNIDDDPSKVTASWGFTVDGVRCGIWDWKGSAELFGCWSVYDPQGMLASVPLRSV